mmetsp:Transcript_23338/g.79659  ORF Transcript_23338/g.79659 Transcript_23338/m.79659 type:complete len:222 (-) Transcript_23338:619-1284(-)
MHRPTTPTAGGGARTPRRRKTPRTMLARSGSGATAVRPRRMGPRSTSPSALRTRGDPSLQVQSRLQKLARPSGTTHPRPARRTPSTRSRPPASTRRRWPSSSGTPSSTWATCSRARPTRRSQASWRASSPPSARRCRATPTPLCLRAAAPPSCVAERRGPLASTTSARARIMPSSSAAQPKSPRRSSSSPVSPQRAWRRAAKACASRDRRATWRPRAATAR